MSSASVPDRLIALALLTQTSIPPKRSTACSTAANTCCSSRMSPTIGSARPPAASICSAAVYTVPSSLGCGSPVFAIRATLAPSRAARSAMASPIPRLAPEMNSVLSASGSSMPGIMPSRQPGSTDRWIRASADGEAHDAGRPGDQAVGRERRQRLGLEVAQEEADGEVGGHPGDHDADRDLAVDVGAGVAEEARDLQHAGGEDHRRREQEGEARGVLVAEPADEPRDHRRAGAADAREERRDLG